MIAKIEKPVRINVVHQDDDTFSIDNVKKYVERWSKISAIKAGHKPLMLNLRGNYATQNYQELHEMSNNKVVNDLAINYYYESHSFCSVCDTCTFVKLDKNNESELIICYHRGVMNTAVQFGNIAELNDLIIFQNGDICYDWDGKKENISKFLDMIIQK